MNRNALLAKVHIGKKAMGWSEDDYRAILQGRYGRQSAAELELRDLEDFCEHLRGQGVRFKPQDKAKEKQGWTPIPDGVPYAQQKKYIAALWQALGWNLAGLDKRVRKQFGVEKLAWLHDQAALQTLAKDLWNRCKKKGLDPEAW